MSYRQTGGCICNMVRYEISGPPLFTHVCHCKTCQKLTGSAFWITMVTLKKDFKFTAGSADTMYVPLDSGAKLETGFCPKCGTRLYGIHENYPHVMVPAVGTLDDTSCVSPQAHIYTRSKQSWINLPDNIPSYSEKYDINELWPKESIERLNEI